MKLFTKFVIVFLALIITAVAAGNFHIYKLLHDYENSLPIHAAESIFNSKLKNPDFDRLIDETGYELYEGETRENALCYFNDLIKGSDISFIKVPPVYESNPDSIVYAAKAGDRIFAKFTISPTGETTRYGNPVYAQDEITLLRRERPVPEPSPEPSPEPKPVVIYNNGKLREEYGEYVLKAAVTYSEMSRTKEPRAVLYRLLQYFDPDAPIYNTIRDLPMGYEPLYNSYTIADGYTGEFVEIDENSFSCKAGFVCRMRKGRELAEEFMALELKMRKSPKGVYLIYDMKLLEPNEIPTLKKYFIQPLPAVYYGQATE